MYRAAPEYALGRCSVTDANIKRYNHSRRIGRLLATSLTRPSRGAPKTTLTTKDDHAPAHTLNNGHLPPP